MNEGNFLAEILTRRRRRVAAESGASTPTAMRGRARRARETKSPHRLQDALEANDGVNIIGEFKRASPSRGPIRSDVDLADIIRRYEAAGVCAVSVLTEPDYFRGSIDDLRRARAVTELPILRKDFIVDEYQIYEAAEEGADAILLIVAALTDRDLARFRTLAGDELGLDVLVEVHTGEEMQRAANCGAKLIGVNNRDLRTFATSLETSVQLAALAPTGATLISESGISSSADIARLSQCGFRGFLIGEALMRSADASALIRSLRSVESEEARNV